MTTAFVFSGGGSLGAVQVGMLQALLEYDVMPDILIGASAGAVNASWVAAHGMTRDSLGDLAAMWSGLRRRDIFPVSARNILQGLRGRTSGLIAGERLGTLIDLHSGLADLRDAQIGVHLVATDLLSGSAVLISEGRPSVAIRASAAIPGILPPVLVEDQWLVDGAIAPHAGVDQAAALGATDIYVLPAGVPCALTGPPRSAAGVALQALTLLIEQRLIDEVSQFRPGVQVRLVPPLCPVRTSAADFSHADELMNRARMASLEWLTNGGLGRPSPAQFLSLHHHA